MVEKTLQLLQSVGKSEFSLEKEIGLAQGSIKHWRTAKSKPSADAIIKIAKYFNVSADYLLGTEPTTDDAQGNHEIEKRKELRPSQLELIKASEPLNDMGIAVVIGYIARLIEESPEFLQVRRQQ